MSAEFPIFVSWNHESQLLFATTDVRRDSHSPLEQMYDTQTRVLIKQL